MNQDGTGFAVANKAFRKATKNDLVYFENSPDYCLQDKSAGEMVAREPPKAPRRLMDVDGLPLSYVLWMLCICSRLSGVCMFSCMSGVCV